MTFEPVCAVRVGMHMSVRDYRDAYKRRRVMLTPSSTKFIDGIELAAEPRDIALYGFVPRDFDATKFQLLHAIFRLAEREGCFPVPAEAALAFAEQFEGPRGSEFLIGMEPRSKFGQPYEDRDPPEGYDHRYVLRVSRHGPDRTLDAYGGKSIHPFHCKRVWLFTRDEPLA